MVLFLAAAAFAPLPTRAAAAATPEASAGLKATEDDTERAYGAMERLTEVMLLVRRHYADEKSYEEIVTAAIQGLLQSLDPHSAYMEPQVYEDMQDETSGHYSGVGIQIGVKDGALVVIAPIEDTPAFRAGIESGDRIVEIDGEKTSGMDLRGAVRRLRGEKGTEVALTIARAGEDDTRAVRIIRDDIMVSSVKGATQVEDGIGYVRVTQFALPTADDLRRAVEMLQDGGMRALVLDLRDNPGGLLESAVRVSEMFIAEGEEIVMVRGRSQARRELRKIAEAGRHYSGFPMVVLVNGGSASASEIVAGALRDNGRAVLVGDKTFGKGSVQSVIPLRAEANAAIRLTTAHYYTPGGTVIQARGIEPDVRVEVPPSEWSKVRMKRARAERPGLGEAEGDARDAEPADVRDRQLDRATDLLRAILVARARGAGE